MTANKTPLWSYHLSFAIPLKNIPIDTAVIANCHGKFL